MYKIDLAAYGKFATGKRAKQFRLEAIEPLAATKSVARYRLSIPQIHVENDSTQEQVIGAFHDTAL